MITNKMDRSNSVHLKWSKHQATLVSVFDVLLDNEKLIDCTISAEGQHLRAQKIILSACSAYFEELFTENYEKHPIIILHDVKYDVVKALMDFMYRGEVNIPHKELSSVLKLSDSLQIRGLSNSGCVDDVNIQKCSGSNATSVPPETLQSQPASVPGLDSSENEAEEKVHSFKACSPNVSSQENPSAEVDSVSKSTRKSRKGIDEFGSDHRADQNAFEDAIICDCDSVCQLSSHQQVLRASSNPAGRSPFSSIPHQSVCSPLEISSGELTFDLIVPQKEKFSSLETILTHQKSANMRAHQEEISLIPKSEVLDSHLEIVEVDDSDYGGEYHDNDNNSRDDIGDSRRENEDLASGENFQNVGMNSLQSLRDGDYLNNTAVTSSPIVPRYRFVCHKCGKSYQYRKGLQRHLKHHCGKEPQFQCPRCNKRCTRSDKLKAHMSSIRCQMQEKYSTL